MIDQEAPLLDVKAAERSKSKAKLESKQNDADLREVMGTPAGRRLVWRQLAKFRLYEISHTGRSASTDFNEGQRQCGLWLLAELMRVCPALYLQTQQEAIASTEISHG